MPVHEASNLLQGEQGDRVPDSGVVPLLGPVDAPGPGQAGLEEEAQGTVSPPEMRSD